MLCLTIGSHAGDYTSYLTTDRGFTEVTSTSNILDGDYYYILASAENTNLIVGVCDAEDRKASWAPAGSLSMCYVATDADPIFDRSNLWKIDKMDSYIGFRNLYQSVSLFQTNENQGYLYFAGFLYEHTISLWDCLTPTYQNGYWMFESGKYPLSGGDTYSGYLGPWNNTVAEGEPMALNRKNTTGDEAGHYRLFRIPKATYEALYDAEIRSHYSSASPATPAEVTYLLTNPSFETGDMTGWTMTPSEGSDMGARNFGLTGMEGSYVGNFYNWWSGVSVEQTVGDLPNGTYIVSGVIATWEGFQMHFAVNDADACVAGRGDAVGVEVSHTVTVSDSNPNVTIKAYRDDVDWWSEGRGDIANSMVGFIKLDNVRLFYLGDMTALPNDETTVLTAGKWYYYDAPISGKYTLTGNLLGMTYCSGDDFGNAAPTKGTMGFASGRVYFKTTRSDATLKVEPATAASTFTAATLNVDGLPESILFISINEGGPGSSGTKLISSYLNNQGYDIVAVQEDFNYHSELISNISGYTWGTHRGKVSSLSNDTDGLGFATRDAAASQSNESWTQFSTSTSTDGNQYIEKGYRYYTVTLANGDVIDVYTTHMDAGDATSSRQAQLQQIANAILSNGNTDRPKIFLGDTNCRWTREDIKANFFDLLTGTYDVSDVWVELSRSGLYPSVGDPTIGSEVVDKIIYINPKGTNVKKLNPLSYDRDSDGYVDSSGNALGDHAPVVVTFGLGLYEEVDNSITIGDIVEDGSLNTTDVSALANILINNILSTYNLNAADMNEDGEITVSDLTTLISRILP